MAGAKPGETKHEKFVRLAEQRTNKAIEMIRLIGNLSNSMNYVYDDEEAEQIFDALEDEIRKAKNKFQKEKTDDKLFSISDKKRI